MSAAESYGAGAVVTFKIVRDWTGPVPLFAFPPREIGLIGDLRDIGDRLVRNQAAAELLGLLIRRCVERTGHAPTAMMLLAALDRLGIPVIRATLTELGLSQGSS